MASMARAGPFSPARAYIGAGHEKNRRMMRPWHFTMGISLALMALTADPGWSRSLDPDAINGASLSQKAAKSVPLMVKLQLLLDCAGFSPGLIDGRPGSNLKQAIAAYEGEHGLKADGELDDELWRMLAEADGDPVLEDYTITGDDVDGPFVRHIPAKLEDMAKLDKLGY